MLPSPKHFKVSAPQGQGVTSCIPLVSKVEPAASGAIGEGLEMIEEPHDGRAARAALLACVPRLRRRRRRGKSDG